MKEKFITQKNVRQQIFISTCFYNTYRQKRIPKPSHKTKTTGLYDDVIPL